MVVDDIGWLDQFSAIHRNGIGEKAFYLRLLQQLGYPVIPGFVLTAPVLDRFLAQVDWQAQLLTDLPQAFLYVDANNTQQLQSVSRQISQAILASPVPEDLLTTMVDYSRGWDCVILRPSFTVLPIDPSVTPSLTNQTTGLLSAQICLAQRSALSQGLKQVWAELFRAKSLFYWQRLGIHLQQVRLAVLVQPLLMPIAAGDLQISADRLQIRAVQGLGQALQLGHWDSYRLNFATRAVDFPAYPAGESKIEQVLGQQTYCYQLALPPSHRLASPLSLPELLTLAPCSATGSQPGAQSGSQPTSQAILSSEYQHQLIHLAQQIQTALKMPLRLEWVLVEPQSDRVMAHSGAVSRAVFYLTQVIPLPVAIAPMTSARSLSPTGEARGAEDGQTEARSSELSAEASTTSRPPAAIGSEPSVAPSAPQVEPTDLALHGIAAAPGRVIAPAWVRLPPFDPAIIPPQVILVTSHLLPAQVLQLRQVAGIVTEQGGLTSHAAILARELGIPAVVGFHAATQQFKTGEWIGLDGDCGTLYHHPEQLPEDWLMIISSDLADHEAGDLAGDLADDLADDETAHELDHVPKHVVHDATDLTDLTDLDATDLTDDAQRDRASIPSLSAPISPRSMQLMLTLSQAERLSQLVDLPISGVGLLRSELLLLDLFQQKHPRDWLAETPWEQAIEQITARIQPILAAFAPRVVFYRSLDLRMGEFPLATATPTQITTTSSPAHPALGWRGTLNDLVYPDLFQLQLAALRHLQADYPQLRLVLPFVRTVEEFLFCRDQVEQAGLTQQPQFQLWIMAEVPSVLLLLPDYVAAGVQGIAIGMNDLTQLLLGIDRDQPQIAAAFDRFHPVVLRAIQQLNQMAHTLGIGCSLCGTGFSNYPQVLQQLAHWGLPMLSIEPQEARAVSQGLSQLAIDSVGESIGEEEIE
ncbi:MAG: PEP-utilizing enzyme [Elainella sp. Prado103]|jgi:pyruvate,water dikinase|nr:PEP-utilizing enzyme [Elainella sp. Prado103]